MRTIIELPEEQIQALGQFCRQERISRAEAIRQTVSKLLSEKAAATPAEGFRAAFGLWEDRKIDSRQQLEALRAEWDRPGGAKPK